MQLPPVAVLPVSEQVFRHLRDAILAGEFTGGALPSERELAAAFTVNRHAVREAIKRLQQARLVEVAQGGATRVMDHRVHGRLDLLPDLLVRGGRIDWEVARSVLEMRVCIGADAARLCALRAPQVGTRLAGIAEAMAESRDAETVAGLEGGFWAAVVDGSTNIAYRLAFNTLVDGIAATAAASGWPELQAIFATEYTHTDDLAAIAALISAADADGAEAAARAYLGRTAATLEDVAPGR